MPEALLAVPAAATSTLPLTLEAAAVQELLPGKPAPVSGVHVAPPSADWYTPPPSTVAMSFWPEASEAMEDQAWPLVPTAGVPERQTAQAAFCWVVEVVW